MISRYVKRSQMMFLFALVAFSTLVGSPAEAARKNTTKDNVLRQSMRPGSIIVSFGDRKLYLVQGRGRVKTYPIGIPRKGFEWKGTTKITAKRKNPRWYPTKRMREENPNLPKFVEGGTSRNPMGKRALYLGSSEYRIHGTPAAWSIGRARSAGCVRMHNSHVIDLYRRARVGARVLVTWKRYQVNKRKSRRYAAKKNKRFSKRSKRSKRLKRYKRTKRSKRSRRYRRTASRQTKRSKRSKRYRKVRKTKRKSRSSRLRRKKRSVKRRSKKKTKKISYQY